MKHYALLIILVVSYQNIFSQSIYREKWKEGIYFQIPISFNQVELNEKLVHFVHEDNEAEFKIFQWPLADDASSQDELKNTVQMLLKELLVPEDAEFLSEKILNEYDPSPDFKGHQKDYLDGGMRYHVVSLWSTHTQQNYAVMLKSTAEYASKYKAQIRRLLSGLEEI